MVPEHITFQTNFSQSSKLNVTGAETLLDHVMLVMQVTLAMRSTRGCAPSSSILWVLRHDR